MSIQTAVSLDPKIFSFFSRLPPNDQRFFAIQLKAVFSYREQEALYNRVLKLRAGKEQPPAQQAHLHDAVADTKTFDGSISLSLAQLLMGFQAKVSYAVPDYNVTSYWIGLYYKDETNVGNYLDWCWVDKAIGEHTFNWRTTKKYANGSPIEVFETRLIKKTDNSIAAKSDNVVVCQGGVLFLNATAGSSPVAGTIIEEPTAYSSAELASEAGDWLKLFAAMPSIDKIDAAHFLWEGLQDEEQNRVFDLLYIDNFTPRPMTEAGMPEVTGEGTSDEAFAPTRTMKLSMIKANSYFQLGMACAFQSYNPGDHIRIFYGDYDFNKENPQSYATNWVYHIDSPAAYRLFETGKSGLKEENTELFYTFGVIYFNKTPTIINGGANSIPYIQIGLNPQPDPPVLDYYDRPTFCKNDAVLCGKLSSLAYDFSNLAQKLQDSGNLGKKLNLELEFERKSYDTQGFIATDEAKTSVYIAFRGSTGNRLLPPSTDWIYNYLAYKFSAIDSGNPTYGALVGMAKRYNDVKYLVLDKVASLIIRNPSINKIYITGHSLGAALANLFSYLAIQEYVVNKASPKTVVEYTFGTPPIVNQPLSLYINYMLDTYPRLFGSYNFYDVNDWVSLFFTEHAYYGGFRWYPLRVSFTGPVSATDAHSLDKNYLPYVESLTHAGNCG